MGSPSTVANWPLRQRISLTVSLARSRRLTDSASRVARLRQDNRGYRVLEDLNTRSAITYLAKVTLPDEA